MNNAFRVVRIDKTFEGVIEGCYFQVVTPGDQVVMDFIQAEEISHAMCSGLNAALEPALAAEREIFLQLVQSAEGIERLLDESGLIAPKLHKEQVAALREALDDVRALIMVPA